MELDADKPTRSAAWTSERVGSGGRCIILASVTSNLTEIVVSLLLTPSFKDAVSYIIAARNVYKLFHNFGQIVYIISNVIFLAMASRLDDK
jgi:hypothetical protein